MKMFIMTALLLSSFVANAAEVNVLEADIRVFNTFGTIVDSRFHIDTNTNEGYVKVSVKEEQIIYNGGYGGGYHDQYGRWHPIPSAPQTSYITILSKTVKVEGLSLVGDKVIYQGEEGEVDCGKMGVSRVFKVPTLYLNGNCKLESDVVPTRMGSKVVVNLITK